MSFRDNGQRRYGHVPPAQYTASNANGLHRQSSFDNGDDAPIFDPNGGNGQHSSNASGGIVNMPREELFMSVSPRSPGLNTFANPSSPAMSGFQHQYQPFAGATQSPPIAQQPYNPQNFARSQSQSQPNQYQPAYISPAPAHQPYNPALYQAPQSSSQPSRNTTVSGYNSYAQSHYAPSASQPPQSPSYWQQTAQQQYAPPVPARPYEQPLTSPTYPGSHSAPQQHNPYSPPVNMPYASNGDNYAQTNYRGPSTLGYDDRGSYDQSQTSFSNRTERSSSHSAVAPPPVPLPNSPGMSGLQRHPTLRPLPITPREEQTGDDDDWLGVQHGTQEDSLSQEQLFADIGDALGESSSSKHHSYNNGNDLLDGELGDLHRYNSRATTIGGAGGVERYASTASTASTLHNQQGRTYDEYDDDDESDLEAAAGLEAMRIAEEQDAQRGGSGPLSFGGYDGPQSTHVRHQSHPQLQDESSDSDYKHMDLGLVGGGYDAHMSYGDDMMNTSHSSEMDDQSRPLPSRHDLGRADSYSRAQSTALGGMIDYSIPGAGEIHPFPAFESARVDESGTGGLQRPTSQSHRMSFDEGDEHVSLQRLTESRQSGRSGSDSPTRDDMPELFYHPGMSTSPYDRPLPAVPPMSDNRIPHLQPAGSYKGTHSYTNSYSSTSEILRTPYPPSGPDSYASQGMLTPVGQYVPRSTSLSSHGSAPHSVPPVRSKTDAEKLKAARLGIRSASGLDGGYGAETPQSSIGLDLPALPAGRRKKFLPARLSTLDYSRCVEPWALSGIASWVREMAGGETGEGESDLREKTIEEGLVALFTHKVPTMNTADAETLSQRVIGSMFDSGMLLPDEEWVKFGPGNVSGVLWQLTGSGCYAPKLHEQEISGRCYSHHCGRTLKKIKLNTQILEPTRKAEDWVTFFKLTKESLEGSTRKEIERQNNLHEIVMSEDIYMDQINVLRYLYRDDLSKADILGKNKKNFIASVFGKIEAIKEVNESYLLPQLKYRQKEQGPWIIGFSDIFREWIRKARAAYIEYAAGFPKATYLVRKEKARNLDFMNFLDHAREDKRSARLDWNTYLKAPITRLQRYTLLLATVHKNMVQDTEEKANLAIAIEEIKTVTLECDAKVDEQTKKVEMIELGAKLHLRPGTRVELNLDHLGREVIMKGDLQRAGANRFAWLDTHAILFDHYLVLAKTVAVSDRATGRKTDGYDVSKMPIPMQLLVLESTNEEAVVKSSVKGIATVTKTGATTTTDLRLGRTATNAAPERSNTLEHSNSNQSVTTINSTTRLVPQSTNDADAKNMYPFRIKHLGKTEVYTLYAPTAQNRQDWCDKIMEAKTRHAASLYEQNAEPFRLRVMADSAFAYDAVTGYYRGGSVVSVQGTPLDRAIRDLEKIYGAGPRPGPVCRAQINCATAFTSFGKSMIAIGTDNGVYTSEATNARGWTRSISMARVTQIAVLEEFSLCLIIADKVLIAYHLDVIVPVSNFPAPHHDSARRAPQKLSGTRDVSFFATARMKDRTLVFYKKKEGLHSTFKVLEPVFQKSSEKKSRIFGKKFSGNTEFFREFDEFYIPTECFTINLFHSYIAISTLKGFELMTLDKKVPMSIPDTKNPAIGNIANRLAGQKPLGMFRLSDAEFLLCYEECGVYVDKHGEVSRSVIMEFVGKAKTAAMYGAYLVLFDSDFVEVRNAENGRLRQVIAGRDVRCLDYGINPQGTGGATSQMTVGMGGLKENRTLKLAMAHPEIQGSQIVLEMVLNEGHSE